MSRLVTIATFETPIEAGIAQNALEAAGIRCFILDDHLAGMNWALTNAIGGVKLQVSNDDAQIAKKILDDDTPTEFPDETELSDDALGNGPLSDEVEDTEKPLTRAEEDADRVFRAAVLGIAFVPLQFYVSWLLLQIFVSNESLRPKQRSRVLLAAMINVPFVLIALALLRGLLAGY